MKRLCNLFDPAEATELVSLLEDRGIAVRAYSVKRNHYPDEWAIDIVLDHQFHDAKALVQNPDHIVANPVDPSEIHREVIHSSVDAGRYMLRFFASAALLAAIAIAVVIYADRA